MATCKDCVHFDVCCSYLSTAYNKCKLATPDFKLLKNIECDECQHFKDRSRFVELPCKLGDTLYTIVTGNRIREWIVVDISFFSYSVVKIVITADSKDNNGTDHMRFGKHYLNHSVFLSREAAEQALKERES